MLCGRTRSSGPVWAAVRTFNKQLPALGSSMRQATTAAGGSAAQRPRPQQHRQRAQVDDAVAQIRDGAKALLGGHLSKAESFIDAAADQFDAAGGAPPWLEWPLHSARGSLAMARGSYAESHGAYSRALGTVEHAAKLGLTADSFEDIGGCLVDLATVEALNGDTKRAGEHLRRAQYMAGRAYKPASALIRDARLMSALLAAERGDLSAAANALRDSLLTEAQKPDTDPVGEGTLHAALAEVTLAEARSLRLNNSTGSQTSELESDSARKAKSDRLLAKAWRSAHRASQLLDSHKVAAGRLQPLLDALPQDPTLSAVASAGGDAEIRTITFASAPMVVALRCWLDQA